MSLRHTAQYLAAHGRGADTTLMHVAPDEVARLQRAAQERGGSLSINPHTGLPEANFFSDLNPVSILQGEGNIGKSGLGPALAALAVNYFAPGAGEALGLSQAAATGAIVGGASALATGSLKKGLMAGIGAYGATGLGEAAMGGVDSASREQAVLNSFKNELPLPENIPVARQLSIGDTIKAGAKGISSLGPKDLILKGSMAAGPILSSLASEKNKNLNNVPSSGVPGGYIRQYYFDPKTQSVKPLAPVRTQDWGDTTFESRVPYIPKSADGGLQSSYAMGGVTDDGTAHFDNGGLTADIARELMQRSMTTGVPNSEIAKYGGYDAIKSMYDAGGGQYGLSAIAPADLQRYANTIAQTGVGNLSALTQAGIAMTPAGIANMQANGTSSGGGSSSGLTPALAKELMQRSMTTGVSNSEIAKYGGYDAIKAMYDAGGGQYSLESINPADLKNYANTIAQTGVGNLTALQQAGVPLTTAGLANMKANGIDPSSYAAYLNLSTIPKPATQTTTQNTTTNPYGNRTTPGDLTRNLDGTLTVNPNIPDRPVGGTTGMSKLISDYTAGGGHLGQVLSPSKAYENTGASADVYKYLMGKGDYPIQETGIGKNSRYYNNVEPTTSNPTNKFRLNPQTRMIELNPDYVAPAANGGLMQAYAFAGGGTTSENPYDFLESTKGTGNPNAAALTAAAFDAMTPAQQATHQAQLATISEGLTPMVVKILKQIKNQILFKQPNEPLAEVVDMSIMSPDAQAQQDAAIALALADSAENAPTVTDNPAALMGDTSGDGGGAVSSGGVSGDSGSPMGGIASTGTAGQAAAAVAAANAAAANGVGGIGVGGGNAGTGMGGTSSGVGTGIGGLGGIGGGLAYGGLAAAMARGGSTHQPFFSKSTGKFNSAGPKIYANGGISVGSRPDPNIDGQYQPYPNVSFQPTVGRFAAGGEAGYNLGGYSDGGRLLRGPGDGVSDSIPATIGHKQPARLADGEFVVPARIVSELGNGSTEAGARKLYAMMERVQQARGKTVGKGKVAKNSRADKYLPK